MQDLQEQYGLTYMFISHDLSVVKFISDRVAVMYLGRIVELAPTKSLFAKALHPYTQALMSAVPVPSPGVKKQRIVLTGDVPNPETPPSGCAFHPRCPYAMDRCKSEAPDLRELDSGHQVSCHLY